MDFIKAIAQFRPATPQEESDRRVILEYIRLCPHNILLRDNEIAHITSSGFIVNKSVTKTLMVHHNIYHTWSWTGGHADGEEDLLQVALREAREETGADAEPLCGEILSLDILPVWGHEKHGRYVSAHLHLSAAYVLTASEDASLQVRPDENSGVRWVPIEEMDRHSNEAVLIAVYRKLADRARTYRRG